MDIELMSHMTRVERAIKSLTRALVAGAVVMSAGLYFHAPAWATWFAVGLTGFLLGLRR